MEMIQNDDAAREYLPADFADRVKDLLSERHMTAKDLAEMAGIEYSRLVKILNGTTQKIGDQIILAVADAFSCTTDFLLGLTDDPGRKNYEIGELGLSVEAAKNLYEARVNREIVNRLLENPRFPELTRDIAIYFDGTMAAGVAAQNQIYDGVARMLRGSAADETVERLKTPPYEPDILRIREKFETILRDIKSDIAEMKMPSEGLTADIFLRMTDGIKPDVPGADPAAVREQLMKNYADIVDGLCLDEQNHTQAMQLFDALLGSQVSNGASQ